METRVELRCPHCGRSLGQAGGNAFQIGRPFRTCEGCRAEVRCANSAIENTEWELHPNLGHLQPIENDVNAIPTRVSPVETWVLALLPAALIGFVAYLVWFSLLKSQNLARIEGRPGLWLAGQLRQVIRAVSDTSFAERFLVPAIVAALAWILLALAIGFLTRRQARHPAIVRQIEEMLILIEQSRQRMADPAYRQQLLALGIVARHPGDAREPEAVSRSVVRLYELKRAAAARYAALYQLPSP